MWMWMWMWMWIWMWMWMRTLTLTLTLRCFDQLTRGVESTCRSALVSTRLFGGRRRQDGGGSSSIRIMIASPNRHQNNTGQSPSTKQNGIVARPVDGHFHSVNLEPLQPVITQWDARCDYGNLFFTVRGPSVQGLARGPVITDARGELVWMDNDQFHQAMNLNVQRYRGEDFLTFWTKHDHSKRKKKNGARKKSKKSFVMLNSHYEVAHRITPVGKGLRADSHEFRITPQGTALIVIYKKIQTDCTDLGLGPSCWVQDGWIQEIDIATGELRFEWHATDHIQMTDVFSAPSRKDGHGRSKSDAFDFFHINSVDKMPSGDFLVSARYMHAVLCVSAATGAVRWQLGGKNNAFRDLNGATDFSWQHHVTWLGNDTISLYDNHANHVLHSLKEHSKAMIIRLDLEQMTAELRHKYVHPDHILNVSQGSVQVVNETGNVLVGFGNAPTYVEFTPEGEVLCQAHFAPHLTYELLDLGLAKSYRVFKHAWVGRPKTRPDVAVKRGRLYVSWNGATEVTGWRLESAPAPEAEFVTLQEMRKEAFESSFALDRAQRYVRVVALDATQAAMARSVAVSTDEPLPLWPIFWTLLTLASLFGSFCFLAIFWKHARLPDPRLPTIGEVARAFRPRLSALTRVRRRLWGARGGGRWLESEEGSDTEEDPLLLSEREMEMEMGVGKETETDTARGAEGGWRAS
ncbi:hypothetical protein B2J93_9310 [Marssonina coronariae]|uniref:Arylsulfotransferase n=1 Tax=Diplocarpon coronariae TaxID=2795749 RepID=A0A218Z924_9HELO|nr:hypothetical protein B2J93_9310 [Marssonina coronariae]